MTFVTTTEARNALGKLVSSLSKGESSVFVLGRRDNPEAVLISFPQHYNKNLSDITNVNSYSRSFDFLYDEPELYSADDILKN
jgi:hypothetical protein